jgi:hypothetical protein
MHGVSFTGNDDRSEMAKPYLQHRIVRIGPLCGEVSIFPDDIYPYVKAKPICIVGLEALSREEALENTCKAAISFLETEASIFLVDPNYNQRAHGEMYVAKAEDALCFISFMGSKILAQWEVMVNEFETCEILCNQLIVNNMGRDQSNSVYKVNYNSMKAVAALHKACLMDLQLAQE